MEYVYFFLSVVSYFFTFYFYFYFLVFFIFVANEKQKNNKTTKQQWKHNIRLSENARLPIKGSEYAAGYDLYSSHSCEIEANGKALVKTDISIGIPIGCYGRIAPRSGLAWKNHIDIGAGVIDSDYRGNVGVVMFNHSNKVFQVTKHMRIAQLILEKYEHRAVLLECDDLDDTVRGDGGFGSTGVTKMMHKLDVKKDNLKRNANANANENEDIDEKETETETDKKKERETEKENENVNNGEARKVSA